MFLKKLFGTSSTRYIKKISPEIQKINDFYDGLSSKSDQDLVDRTNELKKLFQTLEMLLNLNLKMILIVKI